MRILQVIQRFPPSVGGGEEVVYQISKELSRRGHDVTVVTSNWEMDQDIPGFSAYRVVLGRRRCLLPSHERIDGIDVHRFRPLFRLWSYTVNPPMVKFLVDNIGEFDLVNAHYYMFSEVDIAAFLCRMKRVPFAITVHRCFEVLSSTPRILRMLKRIYDMNVGRFTLDTAGRVIVLSQQSKNEFRRLGVPGEKIAVIPNGVDPERFLSTPSSGAFLQKLGNPQRLVLSVGRLEEQKGQQYIIRAIPEICRSYPDTKFVFVGEDWGYQRSLEALSKELGISDKCFFAGRTGRFELDELYVRADVFVMPAVGEGFPLVALEGILSGPAVVLADKGVLGEMLREFTGSPIDMEKDIPSQISRHIKKIFATGMNEEDYADAREKIRRHYSWGVIAEKLEHIYLGAMER